MYDIYDVRSYIMYIFEVIPKYDRLIRPVYEGMYTLIRCEAERSDAMRRKGDEDELFFISCNKLSVRWVIFP